MHREGHGGCHGHGHRCDGGWGCMQARHHNACGGSVLEDESHLNEADNHQYKNNNYNQTAIPYKSSTHHHFSTTSFVHTNVADQGLLLNNCSSINLISNLVLLHGICTVNGTIHVCCNAEIVSTNQMGYLGSYPEPVWYNLKGIANILSQNIVTKHYCLTMDMSKHNEILLYHQNNSPVAFTPTIISLYKHDLNQISSIHDMWAHDTYQHFG